KTVGVSSFDVRKCTSALGGERLGEQFNEFLVCRYVPFQSNGEGITNGVNAGMGIIHQDVRNRGGLLAEFELRPPVEHLLNRSDEQRLAVVEIVRKVAIRRSAEADAKLLRLSTGLVNQVIVRAQVDSGFRQFVELGLQDEQPDQRLALAGV